MPPTAGGAWRTRVAGNGRLNLGGRSVRLIQEGTNEWVQYVFPKPMKVTAVEVYWLDDTGRGHCRVPQSWRLLYRDGGAWR